ncbi:MAG: T9SS type A sorting domain-containing protein [Sediminibacterium sp.]|nr:T9SS type A sorting domain-containing protein [Sediminibacterium sp.]
MRATLTLALCSMALTITNPLSAQQSLWKNPFKKERHAPGNNLWQTSNAEKSTATASRLIAAAGGEYDDNSSAFIFIDSAFVNYSGGRGGDLNSKQIKFDNGMMWVDNGGGLQEAEKMAQTFDGNSNILSTLLEAWDGTAWVNSYGIVYTYDVNNNTLTETEVEWNPGNNTWDSVYRYYYTYNGNNTLLTETGLTNNGGIWENAYLTTYTLDGNDNTVVTEWSGWNTGTSSWDPTARLHYTYNTDNLQTELWDESWQTNTWQKHNRYLTTYNQNDLPATETRQSWDGSNYVTARVVTNTYVNNDLVNALEQYGNGNNATNVDNTFDGNHNMLSRINQYWFNNAWVNDRKMEWTYNSYNQVLTDKMFRWINSAWGHNGGDLTNRYYYETYTTSVKDAEIAESAFKVYPVPATHFVRVEMEWEQPQAFTVSVTDMQGRMIRTFSEKATANYSRNIDVNQLPAGNYVIKVAGVKGKATYQQFSVVR